MSFLYLAFFATIITAVTSYFLKNEKIIYYLNYLAGLLTVTSAVLVAAGVLASGVQRAAYFYIDAISAVMLIALAALAISGIVVSAEYLKRENVPVSKKGQYFFLLQLFILSMLLVVSLDNAGLVWVAIEATTIVSALLVVFHLTRQSLEAAWKYVIICSIGICFALLGTILLYYLQVSACSTESASLNWQALRDAATGYDSRLALLAFLFILIGYGAKAGFVPMHTWLPDAHSQAPAPVSALLSGGLIATAMYVLIRNVIIFKAVLQPSTWQGLLVFFAVLSVVMVIPFMYKQNDIKRLLAYSSIENIGIMALGLSGNYYLAAYGLMFHILNHAFNKSALFYLSGELISVFRTKQIARLSALTSKTPLLGWLLTAGFLSIAGLPPSAVFFSKFYIVFGLMASGHYLSAGIALFAIAAIFMLLLRAMMKICFGPEEPEKTYAQPSRITLYTAAFMLVALLVMGLCLPDGLQQLLQQAAGIIAG